MLGFSFFLAPPAAEDDEEPAAAACVVPLLGTVDELRDFDLSGSGTMRPFSSFCTMGMSDPDAAELLGSRPNTASCGSSTIVADGMLADMARSFGLRCCGGCAADMDDECDVGGRL